MSRSKEDVSGGGEKCFFDKSLQKQSEMIPILINHEDCWSADVISLS